MEFSKAELKIFSAIGINAGQVSFASLLALLFQVDSKAESLVVLLVVTLVFWGTSWHLARKYKI